jgi:hypothetical protein
MKGTDQIARACTCIALVLGSTLLFAVAAKKPAHPPDGPKPGDTYTEPNGDKADIQCVWTVDYISEQRHELRGERGTFGLLLTPVSKDERTTASLTIVQAKDWKTGKTLAFASSGRWEYHGSHLRYISPDGGSATAGADVSGHGNLGPGHAIKSVEINSSGEGANATVEIFLDIDGSLKEFDVDARVQDLKMKDVMHVEVGDKTKTEIWRAHLTGGFASGKADRQQDLTLSYSWGSKTSDAYGTYYGQWTFKRTCQKDPVVPKNDYVPPAVILSRQRYADPTPTPTTRSPAGNAVHTISYTGAEGILTFGGKSPR